MVVSRVERGDRGLTLVEAVIASSVLVVGLVGLAGVFIAVSGGREQAALRTLVQSEAQSLLEEIKGVAPETVVGTYDGVTQSELGLTITVDSTNPKLLVVTVSAEWVARQNLENLVLTTEIYNPKG